MEKKDDASPYEIPHDFPIIPKPGSIGGAMPKILLTEFEGKFYEAGCTPPELFVRWDICEDLCQKFRLKSFESKNGKRADMSEIDILKQYYDRLLETNWVTHEEAIWIFRRVASLLNWESPV